MEKLSGEQVSALKARPRRVYECVQIYYKFEDSGIPENYDVESLSSRQVSALYMKAKTYTVFKIIERSIILDFSLHLIAANYAERLSGGCDRWQRVTTTPKRDKPRPTPTREKTLEFLMPTTPTNREMTPFVGVPNEHE